MVKAPVRKTDYQEGTVYIYQFPRTPHLPNLSPYCLKLETWLKAADVKYEVIETIKTSQGPEGTLPFIEYNGKQYSDSDLIINFLAKELNKEDVGPSVEFEDKAVQRLVERTVEQATMWCVAHDRFTTPEADMFTTEVLGPNVPSVVTSKLFKMLMKRTYMSRLNAVGVGRHKKEEVVEMAKQDLLAIVKVLGSKQFFGGDKVGKADCTVFGMLATSFYAPVKPELTTYLQESEEMKPLKEYMERVKTTVWPNWDELCTEGSPKKEKPKKEKKASKKEKKSEKNDETAENGKSEKVENAEGAVKTEELEPESKPEKVETAEPTPAPVEAAA